MKHLISPRNDNDYRTGNIVVASMAIGLIIFWIIYLTIEYPH